jgi:BirA family biotin operon repressor/biotin-[acetyl-CoA-carboxylase] ligase
MSLVLRRWTRLLPLAAGVAVAEEIGEDAQVKWPNDVLVDGRKVAGILVEGQPASGWMVLGIGVNVALTADDLPPELRENAGGLGRSPEEVETTLNSLLARLERWLAASDEQTLDALRARDALAGREVRWGEQTGRAEGIDADGRLVVVGGDGERQALDAGEVHLTS